MCRCVPRVPRVALAPAGNKLAMQEFMVLPVGAESFSSALQMGCEVYHHLKVG